MHVPIGRRAFVLAASLAYTQLASAQVFVDSPSHIPQGIFNNDGAEQVDFADIDVDGDWDCGIAKGAHCCNQKNRIWVNQGGLQGASPGFFVDESAARTPAVLDQSRDIEFVDFDADGDPDIFSANTSDISNQSGRWWVNRGGLQGGSAGYFSDETPARWVGLGGASSSIPASLVLGSGGFISWTFDLDFADVDADGDLDLIGAPIGVAYIGQEPTRIFLNDGLGYFAEFNPSGFQLGGPDIADGNPALWAEGAQQADTTDVTGAFADIAVRTTETLVDDFDGDLDVDVLLVDVSMAPRLFRNLLSDTGTLTFRDSTGEAWPLGWGVGSVKWEAESCDFDGDDDVDLYGLNWVDNTFQDSTLAGKGDATFGPPELVSGTVGHSAGTDTVDFDADGDLDLYVANDQPIDALLANSSTAAALELAPVPGAVVSPGFGGDGDVDASDVDGDGDTDVIRGRYDGTRLMLNVLDVPDTTAPRLAHLEQPADHGPGLPTPIRVQARDNAGADQTGWADHALLHSLDGGPFQAVDMAFMGGTVFGGAIPAAAVGNVRYFVRSTDEHGNVGESDLKSIDTGGGCSGQAATYCTPKLNSDGCLPRMEFEGAPKVGGLTSFVIRGTDVLANANGLLIYSKAGPNNAPFNGGVLCVGAGLLRTPGQNSGGAGPCGGTLTFDFNSWVALGSDPGLVAGQKVWAQYWYRDVASPGGNGLTNGVTFTLCP